MRGRDYLFTGFVATSLIFSGCQSIYSTAGKIKNNIGKKIDENMPVSMEFGEERSYSFENPEVRDVVWKAVNEYARNSGMRTADELKREEIEDVLRRFDLDSNRSFTESEARKALIDQRKQYRDNLLHKDTIEIENSLGIDSS
jgi:hypothetical protein